MNSSPEKSQECAGNILNQVDAYNPGALIEEFNKIDEILITSDDPLTDGRKFLDAFIEELNTRYALNLTMSEAYKLVRKNLPILQIPAETQHIILTTIELLESNSILTPNQKQNFQQIVEKNTAAITWLTPWFFSKIGKKHKHHHTKPNMPTCSTMNTDLPSNCYMGGCEMMAGALIAILPFPGALQLGGLLIGDGTRRVIDGLVQLGDERRADPNYVSPPPSPGFNF